MPVLTSERVIRLTLDINVFIANILSREIGRRNTAAAIRGREKGWRGFRRARGLPCC